MIKGLRFTVKGGPGSGHHGHAGVPGKVGGSAAGGRGSLAAPLGPAGQDGTIKIKDMLDETTSGMWENADSKARAELKAQVARDLAKETGIPEEDVADFVTQWARSSNDDDMRSLAIQQDAAKEFGMELSEFTQGKIIKNKRELEAMDSFDKVQALIHAREGTSDLHRLYPSDEQRSILRAMYNKTQSELKDRGITEVKAYRGVHIDPLEFSKMNAGGGIKNVQVKTNVLSSWSLSGSIAREFAQDITGGVVFSSVIPASRILSLPTTGFGCLTEGELIVLGGKNDWAEVVPRW